MSNIYTVPANIAERCLINRDTYEKMYQRSITDADGFWADQASLFLDWQKPWDKVSEADLPKGNVTWFSGGQLNVSVNCIDRHLPERAQQTAIIWEGDSPDESKNISYLELHEQVCRLSNSLKKRGVKKGDKPLPESTKTREDRCSHSYSTPAWDLSAHHAAWSATAVCTALHLLR